MDRKYWGSSQIIIILSLSVNHANWVKSCGALYKLQFSKCRYINNWFLHERIFCNSYLVRAIENHKSSWWTKMKAYARWKQSLLLTQKTSVLLLKATERCGSLALEEHVDSIMGSVFDSGSSTQTHYKACWQKSASPSNYSTSKASVIST